MEHPKTVRAAAVQISPVLFSREGTTEKVLDAIATAAQEGVQLIVFPETLVPYYPYFSFVQPPVVMGITLSKSIQLWDHYRCKSQLI